MKKKITYISVLSFSYLYFSPIDVENFELPPSKYSEEMAKSCEKLEESLKRLNSIPEPRKS